MKPDAPTKTGTTIRPRDRDAIIQSLRAGVVPRRGHRHIQVGRHQELEALVRDIDRVADAGSAVRFVIGPFGSGKTFFLSLVRAVGLQKKLVTVHADMAPDRRLFSTGGQARLLYAELMRNMATRSRPDGDALSAVVERFVSSALGDARTRGVETPVVIRERLEALSEMVGGYDFAHVIGAYWQAHDSGDSQLQAQAIRWLRGEFATRTDARKALGVRTIVDDHNVYDQLKLMARFIRLAGYGGLFVYLDELINLYKLSNKRARDSNFEQILRILNDCLQGSAEGLGFVFGGTPEFLTDTRRGLYSYQALQSRLAENSFASDELVDLSGPVLRLPNLMPEDIFVLLGKLRNVYASGDPHQHLMPDEGLSAFMEHCSKRIGDRYFRTPRNTIKEFLSLLAVLEQNPGIHWQELLPNVRVEEEGNPDFAPLPEDVENQETPQSPASTSDVLEPVAASPNEDGSDSPARADDDLASFRL